MKLLFLTSSTCLLASSISARVTLRNIRQKVLMTRSTQETVKDTLDGLCSTMVPPSKLPPDNSSCWQWWEVPANGVLPEGAVDPPKGCDYKPCEDAVCACDDYCCNIAWDLSCRGYQMQSDDILENNYFEVGCSARILCCEPETAYPKPPAGASLPKSDSSEIHNDSTSVTACTPGSPGCCDTMVPPSYLPPDDSSCWQWWTPPADGIMTDNTPIPPKGCNYKPCEAAVCGCDSYCCEIAWDLSCRGYYMYQGDATKNNYFVDGCSAKMLCCEPESAYPDPPIGGANNDANVQQVVTGSSISSGAVTTSSISTVTTSSKSSKSKGSKSHGTVNKGSSTKSSKSSKSSSASTSVTQEIPVQVTTTKAVPVTETKAVVVGGSGVVNSQSSQTQTVQVAVPVTQKVPVVVGTQTGQVQQIAVNAQSSQSNINVGVNIDETSISTTSVSGGTVSSSTITQSGISQTGCEESKGKAGLKGSKKGSKGKSGKSGKSGKKGSKGTKGSKCTPSVSPTATVFPTLVFNKTSSPISSISESPTATSTSSGSFSGSVNGTFTGTSTVTSSLTGSVTSSST